jgi:glutamate dehydrogenase/leucine dehydrogenase/enoyl-CoA hydratase/carnithine racemase
VPDFLANAGGVRVSYFEWEQNIRNERWTEDEVNRKLEESMKSAFDMVYLVSRDKDVTMRQAAYVVAVNKVLLDMQGRAPPSSPANPHEAVVAQVRSVVPYLPILNDPSIFERLTQPDRDLHGSFGLPLDDGTAETVQYGRFQHNLNAGPAKGGIRFAETVTKEEEIALALWMTYKNALIGNPYGGGKGGIRFGKSPKSYSSAELERASRLYIRHLLKDDPTAVGPRTDVPAPDMNTSPREMAWMMDEFIRFRLERDMISDAKMDAELRKRFGLAPGFTRSNLDALSLLYLEKKDDASYNPLYEAYLEIWNDNPDIVPEELAFITGKPVEVITRGGRTVRAGGSLGRTAATGLGVTFIAEKAVETFLKKPFNETTFVVQGFGNVGSYAALEIHRRGGVVTAIADFDGGGIVHNPDGIDVEALFEHFEARKKEWEAHKRRVEAAKGDLRSLPRREFFAGFEQHGLALYAWDSRDILTDFEADVLVPAAIGSLRQKDGTEKNVINGENAGSLKFKVIVEGANGPTSPEADAVLRERGVVAVPDFLANAGGVRVSYFEWEQNIRNERWTEDEVNRKLEESMKSAFDRVHSVASEKGVTMRQAAYIVSIKKVLFDMLGRGPPKSGSPLVRIGGSLAAAAVTSFVAAGEAFAQGTGAAASAGTSWDAVVAVGLIVIGLSFAVWRWGPAWLARVSGAWRDRRGAQAADSPRGMDADQVRAAIGYVEPSAQSLVTFAVDRGVATITLNRPDKLNSVTFPMLRRMRELVDEAASRDDVRVVLFRGAGKAFNAGADIKAIMNDIVAGKPELADELYRFEYDLYRDLARLHRTKPVVTVAHGVTMGSGLGLAMTGLIVATKDAKFAMPETKLGFFPDVGATYLLPKRVGRATAKYLGFTSRVLGGAEAARYGLADIYTSAHT